MFEKLINRITNKVIMKTLNKGEDLLLKFDKPVRQEFKLGWTTHTGRKAFMGFADKNEAIGILEMLEEFGRDDVALYRRVKSGVYVPFKVGDK